MCCPGTLTDDQSSGEAAMSDLDRLRGRLDELDAGLVELLAERFSLSRQVGELKRSNDLAPRDGEREARQMQRIRELAREHGVSPELAESLLRLIVDAVVVEHEKR